jgi:phage terminase large subunit-like protein
MSAVATSPLARWRASPVAFIEQCLCDPETGRPFQLLDAEREFLKHAFTTDEDGRLLFHELLYAAPKKSGKTTFAAIFTITAVLLFGGAYPEAILCANDFEQSVGRVHQMVRRIVEASPLLRAEAKFTTDKITIAGAVISAIPSDYASAAGSNQVVAVFDELWGYVSERSRRLFDELVPPPTRKIACRLTVTYAGFEGESLLLEELHRRGKALPQVGKDLYAGDGLLMFWSHDPVAPWQDAKWLADMRRSLRPNQFLRMIQNQWVSTESSFIDMAWFDQCVDPELRPVVVDKRLPVWIGVDASVKRDSTAIVACTWDDKASKVKVVAHRIYQPTVEDPLDFEATVESTLLEMLERFQVRKVLYDPYQMQSVAQRMLSNRVPMEEFPQSVPNLTEASTNLYELIKGRNLSLYPDEQIRLAISRAVAVETSRGWKISKEKAAHKIDVVIALGMAAHAAVASQSENSYDVSLAWVGGPEPGETSNVPPVSLFSHPYFRPPVRTRGYYRA